MNTIHPQDSLDNLSNLQINRQRQLLAQVKQQFARGLEKLQMNDTREVGIAELKKLIEQYREQEFLRGYIAILKGLKANSSSGTKEHEILVVSILAQTYKQQLLDPIDKPPSLLKTTFRLVETILSYFCDHSPTVQQACARALLDLNNQCLFEQTTQTVFSIIYAPLISILKSGVDKSSQATASASLSELINYNRKKGGDYILARLAPELLSAVFKVNSEYHELFQAVLGMLESQGLQFLESKLVAFLAKIKAVIDGTREAQSTNTTNLNAYMVSKYAIQCKVNVCKIIEKIGLLMPIAEKEKLFQLRIPEALQQAARHRIIQVQMAASRALKAWKGQLVQDSPKARGLSSLEEKRNSKKIERSKSKDGREKVQHQLTYMKEDLQKLVKGGWGASNRAKNYVKRGSGVGGGHISNAQVSPQSRSGSKSHKEHLQELRQFIKKGTQQNKKIDKFVGLVGQEFKNVAKASPNRSKSPVRSNSPVRSKSPVRQKARKRSGQPKIAQQFGQFGFEEDEGDQMAYEPPAPKKTSKANSVQKAMNNVVQNSQPPKSRLDDFGISAQEAEELMAQQKDLMQEGRRLNINFTKMSQSQQEVTPKNRLPPALEFLPLEENNGYRYMPEDQAHIPPPQKHSAPSLTPNFKGLSADQVGQLVEQYNLSQVSQNLNDVLSQSDLEGFNASKYEMLDSRILEPTVGKSQLNVVKDIVAEKKQRKSAVNKFLKKEPQDEKEQKLQLAPEEDAGTCQLPPTNPAKINIDQPAVSLNFTESQESKVKNHQKRQDNQFTLNPKDKYSSLKPEKQANSSQKQIQQQIVMSQYQESFPARDQVLPVILPQITPITQVPLRHSLVPTIHQQRQSPLQSEVKQSSYSRPNFIHEPQHIQPKKQPPENKVDYQNLIKNPPKRECKNSHSQIKGSKVTEKGYPENGRMTQQQSESENLSVQWMNILERVHTEDYNEAYEAALNLDDPIYLLRLMLLSKIPMKKLSPDIFRRVWSKFMEIYSQKSIDVIAVGLLGQASDLDLLSKCLSVEQLQDSLVSLYELSGSSKGKLSYKAATLYNQIDRKLHPE